MEWHVTLHKIVIKEGLFVCSVLSITSKLSDYLGGDAK